MSEDSFLREVEEELRSEKLKAFWRRFAPFVIGAAVLIVLLVAANETWKWWRASTAATASDQYYSAVALIEGGDLIGARAALQELESGPDGYATLARFHSAALLAEEGDAQGAIAAYDALASSLSNPRLRELAYVLGAYLAVDHLDAASVAARVGGLTEADNPMRNNAREALGLAYYRAGDFEQARLYFEAMAADPMVGQETQIRAFVYLEQLAATGQIDPITIPEETGIDITDLDALGAPLEPVLE